MKVNKKGVAKLEANEVRVGNFFVKRESDQMKICDLNGVFRHSVSRRMPIGIWLEHVWAGASNADEKCLDTLKVYISTMWSFFSVAPDDEFINEALRIAREALERHPDWYGFNPSDGDEQNRLAAEEVKEMAEFENEVKEMGDGD